MEHSQVFVGPLSGQPGRNPTKPRPANTELLMNNRLIKTLYQRHRVQVLHKIGPVVDDRYVTPEFYMEQNYKKLMRKRNEEKLAELNLTLYHNLDSTAKRESDLIEYQVRDYSMIQSLQGHDMRMRVRSASMRADKIEKNNEAIKGRLQSAQPRKCLDRKYTGNNNQSFLPINPHTHAPSQHPLLSLYTLPTPSSLYMHPPNIPFSLYTPSQHPLLSIYTLPTSPSLYIHPPKHTHTYAIYTGNNINQS